MANKVLRDAIWKSQKLDRVQPEAYRDHYPRLLLYGFMDGTFEFDVKAIWSEAFNYNRPGITLPMLEQILTEYQRVGLLYRWSLDGKEYGYWEGTLAPTGHYKKSGIKIPEVRENSHQSPALQDIVLQSNTLQNNGVAEIEQEQDLEQEQEEEIEQDREGTNVPSGAVLCVPTSSSDDLPGTRGTITNPADIQARRLQQAKAAKTPTPAMPPPAGPEHPVAQKFLEFVGRLPKYQKQANEWDRLARQLEAQGQYSRADLLGVIEWMWSPHTDRWWANKIEDRRTDPFEFFSNSIVSIMEQYQHLLAKQKRSATKEAQNGNNNDSSDYNPVSSW